MTESNVLHVWTWFMIVAQSSTNRNEIVWQINKWSEGSKANNSIWRLEGKKNNCTLSAVTCRAVCINRGILTLPCVRVCACVCLCHALSGPLTGWAFDRFSGLWQITHYSHTNTGSDTVIFKDHCQPILCNAGGNMEWSEERTPTILSNGRCDNQKCSNWNLAANRVSSFCF